MEISEGTQRIYIQMIAKRVLIQSKPSSGKQQTKADVTTVLLRAFHTGMEVCVRVWD